MALSFIVRFVFPTSADVAYPYKYMPGLVAKTWYDLVPEIQTNFGVFLSATFSTSITLVGSCSSNPMMFEPGPILLESVTVMGSMNTATDWSEAGYQVAVEVMVQKCKELMQCEAAFVMYLDNNVQVF